MTRIGGQGKAENLLQSSHSVNEIAEVIGNLPQVLGVHRLQGVQVEIH